MPSSDLENSVMPDATTTPFIEGQGISVALRDVETELARLWAPAAEQLGTTNQDAPNVTRVVLANLVVECLSGNAQSLSPVLETVIARFPCRAILLCNSPDPDRRITAESRALPSAVAWPAASLLGTNHSEGWPQRSRPASRGGPFLAGGQPAASLVVDWRPQKPGKAFS